MSLARHCLLRLLQSRASICVNQCLNNKIRVQPTVLRSISFTACRRCEEVAKEDRPPLPNKNEGEQGHHKRETQVEESVKYMKSSAFKEIYGDEFVWKYYRRNHRGHYAPKPRISCTHRNKIITASPCPLCRDDYLIVSYKNLDLLQQFLSPLTGQVLDPRQTGVCMKQQRKLELELARAHDHGVLEKHLKFREYDNKYYRELAKKMMYTHLKIKEKEAKEAKETSAVESSENP